MGIVFEHKHDGDAVEVLDDEYVIPYLEIQAEPPYNSNPNASRERYLERTRRQVGSPGFHLVSARDDGRLIGWAFGLPFAAGRWWGGNTTPAPEDVVESEKFAVIELNVIAERRGHGHGRRLLDELLGARPEPWATLLSLPRAPAHDMYEHLGWHATGTNQPTPDADVADVMVLKLGGPLAASPREGPLFQPRRPG
ncbi:GNAT family N-acetyltransferase [Sphaerisporangium corydalis]|uniref:GNAT family N-acetyltransferase n=1 Tax=Sphaerisporangium corydalis TaxID=1441875 RepID=A0ABV9EMU9_9ACTN|nr:GNAT family N-acetyltransferase [Sphaerisporangium corydalis]